MYWNANVQVIVQLVKQIDIVRTAGNRVVYSLFCKVMQKYKNLDLLKLIWVKGCNPLACRYHITGFMCFVSERTNNIEQLEMRELLILLVQYHSFVFRDISHITFVLTRNYNKERH